MALMKARRYWGSSYQRIRHNTHQVRQPLAEYEVVLRTERFSVLRALAWRHGDLEPLIATRSIGGYINVRRGATSAEPSVQIS